MLRWPSGSKLVRNRFKAVLCFAGCALAAVACGRDPATTTTRGTPDLLLVTIDTLRADRLQRGLMPQLDGLVARGLQFTNARATAPLTLPSHVSMLTGALPPQHGVLENGVYVFRGSPSPVARVLKDRGYRTAAFVGAYVLDRRFGLADGFDHYDDQIVRDRTSVQRLEAERPAAAIVDRAVAWLRSPAGAGPAFAWVHFYEPHAPYAGSYDNEVARADAQLGRLLEFVRALGRDPVVIVTGDHGESLGEHGEATHGMLVYDAVLHVPLVLAGPGVTRARRDDPVSLVDVAPTLAALAGASTASSGSRSLLDAPVADREVYAETRYPRVAGWSPVHTVVRGPWKLILSGEPELYDIVADPRENANVAGTRAATVSAMAARVEALRAVAPDARRAAASTDAAEKLRTLGYVSATPAETTRRDAPNPVRYVAAWSRFEAALAALTTDRRAATAQLEKLAAEFPDAPVFQSTRARALSDGGAHAAALAIYRRAVARWPEDANLFHELAVAARLAGNAAEALKAERAALALEPELSAAHNGVGLLMTDASRHDEASAAFERATASDPTNAEYWVNLGNARRASGNVRAARDAYRSASDLEPSSADAANGLGVLLVQERRALEAIPLFERALASAPDFTEARLNLGIAYQEGGQPDRAASVYREVLAAARPGSPERRAAADLLRSLGR
jgi:choline-sulfatase